MDAIRLDAREFDIERALDEVEGGATVEITRDGRPVATLAPVPPDLPRESERPAPHPSWKEAGVDWDETRRFAATLPYDPTNSVEEMRREDRY